MSATNEGSNRVLFIVVGMVVAAFAGFIIGMYVNRSPISDTDYQKIVDSLAVVRSNAEKNIESGALVHDSLARVTRLQARWIQQHDSIQRVSDATWRRKWREADAQYRSMSTGALHDLAIIKYEEYLRTHPNDTLFNSNR